MPDYPPLGVAGRRDPQQRPQPIPKPIREVIALLVAGKPDDPDCAPLGMVEACKLAGVKPDVFRKHLDRPAVRAALLAERRRFRDLLCASNEAALARIRSGENAMAAVRSIQVLEGLSEVDSERHGRSNQTTPGVTIRIVAAPEREPVTIDAMSAPTTDTS